MKRNDTSVAAQKPVERRHNRLIHEKSPYLLEHAFNPVDWHPWGDEAFKKAKEENKPIFLSIGYSTCHWCHVMEKESFEDPEVAELLNDLFVSIKVDREERPDIDSIYMRFCQIMTGGGGWPLTIFMTPDKKPFFAATYIPKHPRFGRIGLLDLIPEIKEIWEARPEDLLTSADQISSILKKLPQDSPGQKLDEKDLKLGYDGFSRRFDQRYGGFGTSPKFPVPHTLFFLLRYWKRTGEKRAMDMVKRTLDAMHSGGIFDHIGLGFHRYSTDRAWLLPHFEKMLYDQALVAMAYTEAYQAVGDERYAKVARQVLDYVLREMRSGEGGFYSGEDADSEGVEGKFYLWRCDEIRDALLPEDANFAIKLFNLLEEGNFVEEVGGEVAASKKTTKEPEGRNILHLTESLEEIKRDLGISEDELYGRIEDIRQRLFEYREKRPHPHKDDKILADWNGLMIAALAKGAQVFDEPRYSEAAERAADFILGAMLASDGRLSHRFRDGQAAIPAYIDDYAFLSWGLIELYEATFDLRYLRSALDLCSHLMEHFWDEVYGGFYFVADYAENLILRTKEISDGAIPSGNGVSMLNLLRLSRITGNPEFEERASAIGRAFSGIVRESQSAHAQLLVAVDYGLGPSHEVIVVGRPDAADTEEMLLALRRRFIPNKAVIFRQAGSESEEIDQIADFIKNHKSIDGRATAYVCLDHECKLPTTDINKMLELLGESE